MQSVTDNKNDKHPSSWLEWFTSRDSSIAIDKEKQEQLISKFDFLTLAEECRGKMVQIPLNIIDLGALCVEYGQVIAAKEIWPQRRIFHWTYIGCESNANFRKKCSKSRLDTGTGM